MQESVLTRTFALARGPRVRLRLARPSDQERVEALLAQRDIVAGDLDVRRLLAFDPGRRHVVAAFAPIDGAETLVGIAGIDLDPDAEVDTLVVDGRLTRGLGELLVSVLRERARSRHVA